MKKSLLLIAITTKGVTVVNNLIVSGIASYPAFYTQLIFN